MGFANSIWDLAISFSMDSEWGKRKLILIKSEISIAFDHPQKLLLLGRLGSKQKWHNSQFWLAKCFENDQKLKIKMLQPGRFNR